MATLNKIDKLTDNKFLNLFEAEFHNEKTGKDFSYYIASRRHSELMSCKTKNHNMCDAVMIVPFCEGGNLVLIKQFRPAINDYIYEFPAGLVDPGESIEEAVARELYEETGLKAEKMNQVIKPSYTSVGMSDENCAIYSVKAVGTPNTDYKEENEDIEICIVNLEDIPKFLTDHNVSIKTALTLQLFYTTAYFTAEVKNLEAELEECLE